VLFALVMLTLMMVSIAIGLQYHFNPMAKESVLAQYQLSAATTRDHLKGDVPRITS
jgi:hypothetical protein